MKRAKYKAKNIHAYKRIFECTHPECSEPGIIVYVGEDISDENLPPYIRRCIPHIHWKRPERVAKEASDENIYRTMTDVAKWLNLANYHKGVVR